MLFRRTSSTYLPDNSVKLVAGGYEYFQLLNRMINEAKCIIHFQFYIFDEDETGRFIADSLIKAAERNVKVYVLVDGFASQALSRELIGRLSAAGIHFQRFEPVFKSKHFYFGRRLHQKVVVVDGFHGLVGGMNISDRYNDMPEKPAWLDWAIYVEGNTAKELATICSTRIKIRVAKFSQIERSFDLQTDQPNCEVRARENDWVHRKREIYKSYLEMFRNATHDIIIMSPYFLPGNEFRRNMRKAIKRGVRIKLVLAGVSDIFLSKHAERFVYRWLLKNKIEIYEYQKNVLHGKLATGDGEWVTVGSYNVNDLSAHASIELNLDVKNKPFAKQVEERLENLIKNECICITPEVYKNHTNLFNRIVQRFSYDFFRLVLFLFTFYFKQRE
jgi:cardiolipin synthase